jgi:TP901 family phage tail tape measure protein
MQKQLAAGVTPQMLNDQRYAFNKDFVNSGLLKDYALQSVKARSATQDFTEALVKQDVGLRRAVASRNMFNDVLREQINLQKMLAVQWSRNASGQVTADIIMPKGVDSEVGRLTGSLKENAKALATNRVGTAEFAQAAEVARMRLGLFNEIVASSADNMIKWGKNTQWAGRQLMVGFTVPFAAFAAVAGVAANNVDKEMTRILKVYDTTATDVLGKEKELQQVRTSSMSAATEVARRYGAAVQDTLKVEAQLAATGLKGVDLMKSTSEVMRIATLGEMDYQKATEMTIALQTAFRLNTEQTTDAMNYMNSVENATSLSLQDFADATPRAAAALAGLGVNVKEMGVLLVAMKERGVDATEGANALKSATTRMLNPTNKAVESFKAVGISLKDISEQSQGNLFEALEMMGNEFKRVGLSAYEQQKLIADAFGTYQFNRLNAALQGVTEQSGQTGKAMELMGQSAAEAADMAQTELDRAANSLSGRFKRAVEGLKAELASIGEPFLEVATTVVNVVSQILRAFNSLPDGVKMFGLIVAGAAALAGPLIMITGLMANLIGQALKMGTSLVMLTTRYKTMTTEQKAQALLAKQNSLLWSQEASSAQLLSAQLANLTSRFETLAVAQAQAQGLPITGFGTPSGVIGTQAPALKKDTNGQYRRANGTFASAVEIKDYEAAERASKNIQQNSAETERNWTGIAAGAGALAVAGTTTASMVAPTNDLVNNLTNAALTAAMIGPFILKGLRSEAVANIGKNIVSKLGFGKGGKLATGAAQTFKAIGLRIAALGPQLLRLAGPIGFVGAAALGVWLKIRSEQKKSREAMQKIGESTKDWADILGYVRLESGKITDAQGNQVDTMETMAEKLRNANAPLVERLKTMKQLNQENKLLDAVTMEGIKVRQSGGTAEQAKKAMKIALVAAGFTEQEIDVNILPKIHVDLSDQQAVIDKQVDLMGDQLENAFRLKTQQSKWEGFSRFMSGSKDELNTSGKEQAWQLANQFWETFTQQDQIGRLKYFNQFQKEVESKQNEIWSGIAQETRDSLQKVGIANMQQLQEMVVDSQTMTQHDYMLKYSQEQIMELAKMRSSDRTQIKLSAEAEQELAQQIAKNNGMTDKEIENIKTLNDVRGTNISMARVSVEAAKANYEQTVKEAKARGGLSEAEQLNALNQFRLSAGLSKATSLSQGFGAEVAKNSAKLDENSNALDNSIMTAEEWAEAWNNARKDAMSGAQDMALQQADRIFDEQAQNEIDAINQRGERRQDALDAAGERADARFDARQEAAEKRFDRENKALDARFDARAKALSDRWETTMDNFDRNWDARKDREEAYYDNRIEKIQDAIEAEEKAEDIRQRIFEAEKTRLERMANIANQRIDFNIALQTGNLDEAAKVFNNMQAEQDSWSIDDASQASADGSETRKDQLQKQIDTINLQKEARLKALDVIEAREKDALEKKKEREEAALTAEREREEQRLKDEQDRFNRSLTAERDRYNKGIQAAKDAAAAETKAQVDAHQRVLDDRKAKLELELLAIRSSTPRNKKEYDAQIAAIEGAYNKYGVRLQGYGRTWSGYIGSYLTSNIAASAAALKDQVKWKEIAAEITKQFVDGAFGMSLAEFSKWVTTGEMPATSAFGKGGALSPQDALAKQRAMERAEFRHTGGIIGDGPGSRAGKTGRLHSDEVPLVGLKGEGVLNRKATRTLGADFINAANRGKLSAGVNDIPGKHAEGLGAGPGMGLVGAAGAGIAGMLSTVAASALVRSAMSAMASTTGGFGPGQAGKYGSLNFNAEQLQNAATIASVGRSMGMSTRDIQIGIMTAITESGLKNINYGDRDSVGLFQQRPSQGWGSIQQIMDPNYASRKFFEGLKGVKGRATMDPWLAAQAVQRSFDSTGSNYRQYWDEAMAIFMGMNSGQIGNGNVLAGPFGPANGVGSRAIQWAQSRIGDSGWYALCQKFVRMALGAGPGFPSAISAWQGARYKHGINNPTQVPAGVPVYWSGGQYGHVALSTGGGRIISTDFPNTGRIGAGTIAGLTSAWHKPLLGWTEDINGKRIYGVPGLNTGGFTLNDGYAKLHANEAVLTAPLTEQLKSGIQKIDQGVTNGDFIIDMRGSIINKDVDIERAVEKALEKRNNRLGKGRKIT